MARKLKRGPFGKLRRTKFTVKRYIGRSTGRFAPKSLVKRRKR